MRVTRFKDDSRWCGPAAISAVAGITTGRAAALLREISGKRTITRVTIDDIQMALLGLGHLLRPELDLRNDRCRKDRPTFATWLREHNDRSARQIYMVAIGRHIVVLRGDTIWDNEHHEGVPTREYPHRRLRVVYVGIVYKF
ncbi:MAG: hypothetical protein ACJ746_18225 [Bryobacteraceae bacterium]